MSTKVTCTDCGMELPAEWANESAEHPCPQCGSFKKLINLNIVEHAGLEIHDNVRGKVKDINLPSKKNPRLDFFTGDDLRKSDGKWMQKERVIDRDKDQYKETVVDPQTGQVIHHNEEPLSEHFGHGSAKFNNDKA